MFLVVVLEVAEVLTGGVVLGAWRSVRCGRVGEREELWEVRQPGPCLLNV